MVVTARTIPRPATTPLLGGRSLVDGGDGDRLHEPVAEGEGGHVGVFVQSEMDDPPIRRRHGLGRDLAARLPHGIRQLVGLVPQLALPPLTETTQVDADHGAAAAPLGYDAPDQMLEGIEPLPLVGGELLLEPVALHDDVDLIRAVLGLDLPRQPHPLEDPGGHVLGELEGVGGPAAHPDAGG
jgi:hypothetical protein